MSSQRFFLGGLLCLLITAAAACRSKTDPADAGKPDGTAAVEDQATNEPTSDDSPDASSGAADASINNGAVAQDVDPTTGVEPAIVATWDAAVLADVRAAGAETPAERLRATEALDQLPDPLRRRMPELLQHSDATLRAGAAAYLIDRFDPTEAPLLQAFTKALEDSDPNVRHVAIQAFNRMPIAARSAALPQITRLLHPDRETPRFRALVAQYLGGMETAANPAAAAIQQAAQSDPEPSVRTSAYYALTRVTGPEVVIPVLQQAMLTDPAPEVRRLAAVRLGRLGVFEATMARDLTKALGDEDLEVRDAAADALLRMGPLAVSPLAEALESQNVEVRRAALAALGNLGPIARPAADAIRKRLGDSDPKIREAALAILRLFESP